MVGLCLGQIGRWLGGNLIGTKLYWIAALSLALAVREWGWINFYIPERERQSEKAWAHQFGFVMASAMWGFHIGLGFATRVNVGGFWLVVALAVVFVSPMYGGALMLMYWLGRAFPVWLGPGEVATCDAAAKLPEKILLCRCVYSRLSGAVLAWFAGLTILAALARSESLPLRFIAGR